MEEFTNMIENRPSMCLYCGTVNNGRESDTTDRYTKETITECIWSCSKCGRVFKHGIVSIKKAE